MNIDFKRNKKILEVFFWLFLVFFFIWLGKNIYEDKVLEPKRTEHMMSELIKAENVSELAVYLDPSQAEKAKFMITPSIEKARLAEQGLRMLAKNGNGSAVNALIQAGISTQISEMLLAGEINQDYKKKAIELILKDINKKSIADLGELKDKITIDIMIENLNSSNIDIVLNGWKDISKVCVYSPRMLSLNNLGRAFLEEAWLRDKLLDALKNPKANFELNSKILLLLVENDKYVTGGALYLITHLKLEDLISKHWSNIRSVIKQQIEDRQGELAQNNWQLTQAVLLEDIRSSNYKDILNALVAFIGIGNKEIIPKLIDILNDEGTKEMAEAFLNSGSSELNAEAKKWAAKSGYTITQGPGYHPVNWGGW